MHRSMGIPAPDTRLGTRTTDQAGRQTVRVPQVCIEPDRRRTGPALRPCITLASVSEQDSSVSGLRASDAERDAVVGRLNQAVGEGRLTMDEFTERLELAYAGRT